MPFTPAHPAVVLPFLRVRHLSATALIAGSIAPDFEYFLKMQEGAIHSHTWPGLFYFDLPITIILCFLFHSVVKLNLIANMPAWLQARFQDTLQFDLLAWIKQRPALFVLSCLIGCSTHLVWDSFTHRDGYFVNVLWFYEDSVVPFEGARYPLWYALQHLSTYIGMFFVIVYILLKPTIKSYQREKPTVSYWLVIVVITVSVVWLRFAVQPHDKTIGNVVISAITGLCLGLVIGGRLPRVRRTLQT